MRYRVFFIDDDTNLLEGLKRSFRKKKDEWDVSFYDDPTKALAEFEDHKIDIVVTDYKMPGMDGLELLERIKESSPDTVRILLSGQSESEIFEKAKKLDHLYVAKPCSNDELISVIEKGLINR